MGNIRIAATSKVLGQRLTEKRPEGIFWSEGSVLQRDHSDGHTAFHCM